MKIRRKHCYPPTQFTFAELNKYGVNAVRGPRRIPESLLKALEAKAKGKQEAVKNGKAEKAVVPEKQEKTVPATKAAQPPKAPAGQETKAAPKK